MADQDRAFTAGAAQLCITPPVGVSLAGYFHDRISRRVRDDLFAHALVMRLGDEAFALVSCDLIAVDEEWATRAKALVEERTGIAPERVLICATHTHTGPEVRRGRAVAAHGEWLDALPGRVADAVAQADEARFAAKLHPARANEPHLALNRLFRMKDGSELFGRGAPGAAIGPAGGIDPDVLVLKVADASGRLRALVVNYALHPDVIGGGSADFLSADWPGEVAKAVSAVYGEDVVTLFMNGCCGDINHTPHAPTELPRSGPEKAVQLGRALAGIAINAAEKAEPVPAAAMGGALERLAIPYYTRDEEMRAYVEGLRAKAEPTYFEGATIAAFDAWALDGQTAQVPLQALRVGDVALVALPGEIFHPHGLAIKHWSPAPFTFVVEQANAWFGYVPTTDQAERGAYGARPILSRRLCADAGRRLADAAQVMLWKLWEG